MNVPTLHRWLIPTTVAAFVVGAVGALMARVLRESECEIGTVD